MLKTQLLSLLHVSRVYLNVDSRVDEKKVILFGFAIKYVNEKAACRFLKRGDAAERRQASEAEHVCVQQFSVGVR